MRRREFIAGLGAAATTQVARAQQGERVRRVAMLMYGVEDDPTAQANAAVLRDELTRFGWIEGRNLRTHLRFSGATPDAIRADVDELVSLAPDLIIVHTGPMTRMVQSRTRTIPIVFAAVGDPVANGYVASLSQPEGNTTGVTNLYFSVASKWVELLKDAVPSLERVAYVYPAVFSMAGYWGAIEMAAPQLKVRALRFPVNSTAEIEQVIDAFAVEPNGGLIVAIQLNAGDRESINQRAIVHRLPTIYEQRIFVTSGGLMSYGANFFDLLRRAAFYADRILRGAKPSDLPVEFPTKFDLVVNMRTAKAIGFAIPESFLLRAAELIE